MALLFLLPSLPARVLQTQRVTAQTAESSGNGLYSKTKVKFRDVNAALPMRRAASAGRPDAIPGRDHSIDIYSSTSVDARFREPENVPTIQKSRIDASIARVLRIALSSPQPIAHRTLRAKALQGDENTNASKAAVDLALLTLVDHQFLVRHGNGNFASYTVATDSFNVAQEIAYSEFLRSEPFRRSSKPRSRLRSPSAFAPSLGAQLGGGKRSAMEEWTTECSTYKRNRSHHAKSPRQSPAPMSP